ncbi:hypothetical protein KP509_03G003200 [Ceratopteris richardii]|uniref:Uncharacterized protein n=1 Tax=Ceratopteris richardii TaxID=49495 RepID=A0A8T2V3D8_CERRI|nr:hypothetical protein KP509_03G003200 [Ceratopteris richardii]
MTETWRAVIAVAKTIDAEFFRVMEMAVTRKEKVCTENGNGEMAIAVAGECSLLSRVSNPGSEELENRILRRKMDWDKILNVYLGHTVTACHGIVIPCHGIVIAVQRLSFNRDAHAVDLS